MNKLTARTEDEINELTRHIIGCAMAVFTEQVTVVRRVMQFFSFLTLVKIVTCSVKTECSI